MTTPTPSRWKRLGVRDRVRAMLPSAGVPEDGLEEPPTQRGLAMVLSLVVATVMWFSFSMRETYPVELTVPIEVAQTPPGTALREAPPEAIVATFEGEGWELLSFIRTLSVLRINADRSTINLAAALGAGLPAGIQIRDVRPAEIELALDTRTRRRLPIRLRDDIRTETSYDLLGRPRLSPDTVEVTGAQSLLAVLDDWPTERLTLENIDQSTTRMVALADTFGGLLTPAVEATRVRVEVGEFTEGRRRLEVEVENLPPDVAGVRFDPREVDAVFRTPLEGEAYNRALTSPDFRAVVDYFNIRRDTTDGEVPVSPRWPSSLDIRDVRLQPNRVGYFIQRPAAEPDDLEDE